MNQILLLLNTIGKNPSPTSDRWDSW